MKPKFETTYTVLREFIRVYPDSIPDLILNSKNAHGTQLCQNQRCQECKIYKFCRSLGLVHLNISEQMLNELKSEHPELFL